MGRKLIVQIPCLNERLTLPETIAAIPRNIEGFETVEILVIDDGSTDGTAEVARQAGADHVIRLQSNQGLARAFCAGLETCVRLGADVIVNTDGDQQYCADDIPSLVAPILRGEAAIVVGERPIWKISSFPWWKKVLQRLGSCSVRLASRTEVPDATSGFRAFTRDAAMRLHVFGTYTYTLETLVQAGRSGLTVASVPVRTHPPTRPSRLMRNVPEYLAKSFVTLLRSCVTYRAFQSFFTPACLMLIAAFALGGRFLGYYFGYFPGGGAGHIQSLILAAVLGTTGVAFLITGLVVDLIAVNRQLLESIEYRTRQLEVRLENQAQTRGEHSHSLRGGGLVASRFPPPGFTPADQDPGAAVPHELATDG